jgi:hypothetical protein
MRENYTGATGFAEDPARFNESPMNIFGDKHE